MEMTTERVLAWWRETLDNIKKRKWWLIVTPIVLWFISGLAEDRFFHWINAYLDSHAPDAIVHVRSVLAFRGSFVLPIVGFFVVLLILIIRAYFQSQPGLVGNADLMVQDLDIGDLKLSPNWESYEINLAAFARMEVASLDRPRTVQRFEIEMIAPDGTQYRANSEYEIGDYLYQHEVTRRDDWGMTCSETVREPMEDLAAKTRTPIQPLTHVGRAWVRFEIHGVKQGHEPKNCRIKIFAVDPSGKRHEITTDNMRVVGIGEDREYVVARNR